MKRVLSMEEKFDLMKKQNRELKTKLKETERQLKFHQDKRINETFNIESLDKIVEHSVKAGLKSCINDHGPIGYTNVSSAIKRVAGNLRGKLKC